MARDGGRDPYDDGGGSGMRYLVMGLIAVIIGLVVAIIILAGSDSGNDQTGSETNPIPTRPVEPDDEDSGGVTPEPEPTPDEGGDGGSDGGSSGGGSSGGVSPQGGSSGSGSGGIGP